MCEKITTAPLTEDKVAMVSSLLARSWKHAYKGFMDENYLMSLTDENWIEYLENSMKSQDIDCYIVQKNENVIGTTIFGKSITEQFPNDGEIISMYLDHQFMGQGIGKLLFTKAESAVKEQGYANCIICTFTENKKAIKFYKSYGYEIVLNDQSITMGSQNLTYVVMRKSFL